MSEPRDPIEQLERVDARTQAWNDLFRAARACRDFMLEDNGNTRMVDPNDTWLTYMIGRLDDIIGHWDPDATPEEVVLAYEAALTFGGRRMQTEHPINAWSGGPKARPRNPNTGPSFSP
jgi:hypothetical protein